MLMNTHAISTAHPAVEGFSLHSFGGTLFSFSNLKKRMDVHNEKIGYHLLLKQVRHIIIIVSNNLR